VGFITGQSYAIILNSPAPVIFFQQRERKIDAGGEASRGVEIAVLNPDRP
jgi:hypothetical protein